MTSDQIHQELRDNRDAITGLQARYQVDMEWLKQSISSIIGSVKAMSDKLDKVDRTVHNGLSVRVQEMHAHLLRVENCVDVIEHDVEVKFERRHDEWHKTAALVVAIIAVVVSAVAIAVAMT